MASFTRAEIPNILCGMRIALILPLWAVWSSWPQNYAYKLVFALFMIAALSDWLDGYLARKWAVQSPLGAMLDQIADKLLMISVLMILLHDQIISSTLIGLLILREIWVSGLREYVGSQGKTLPVSKLGKWKTASQMIGVSSILATIAAYDLWSHNNFFLVLSFGGIYALWASALLGWVSAFQYSKILWR